MPTSIDRSGFQYPVPAKNRSRLRRRAPSRKLAIDNLAAALADKQRGQRSNYQVKPPKTAQIISTNRHPGT